MSTSLTPDEFARRASQEIRSAKKDLAELTRLRAENARLREAGQAVVHRYFVSHDAWDLDAEEDAMAALRAALKEGGQA